MKQALLINHVRLLLVGCQRYQAIQLRKSHRIIAQLHFCDATLNGFLRKIQATSLFEKRIQFIDCLFSERSLDFAK